MVSLGDEQQRERDNTGTRALDAGAPLDLEALARWMAANVEGYQGPLEARQFKGGQSNPTYQLVTPSRAYVLRRKPSGPLLPSAHAVDREFKVISALHPTGFPVAKPYGLCTDDSVLGAMFYVMEMVEGRVLWDQTLPACEPAERHALYMAQVHTLAALHNTDYAAIGLSDYGRPGNYMGRQIERWTRQYRASETEHIPAMERLIDWLPGALPAQERTAIVHGDYRLDNMIMHASEPRVLAVLDWELSTLGEPLADFTYLLMNWRTGPIAELPDLAAHGIPSMDETIAEYCRLTGRDGISDVAWYFAYNAFRLAAICQGIAGRIRDGASVSPHAAATAARVHPLSDAAWAAAQEAGA